MAKKVRRIGCPSSSAPPADTPAWTIDKEWKKVSSTEPIYLYCWFVVFFFIQVTPQTHMLKSQRLFNTCVYQLL